jgi:hypothetical protein
VVTLTAPWRISHGNRHALIGWGDPANDLDGTGAVLTVDNQQLVERHAEQRRASSDQARGQAGR